MVWVGLVAFPIPTLTNSQYLRLAGPTCLMYAGENTAMPVLGFWGGGVKFSLQYSCTYAAGIRIIVHSSNSTIREVGDRHI